MSRETLTRRAEGAPASPRRRGHSRGMILITVLWIVLILSLVSFSLASAVRVEMTASQADFDSERAFYMARGAVETVYNNVVVKHQNFSKDSPVQTENGEYIFPFDSGEARVRFQSGADRINLNAASDKLLTSMFDSLGLDEQTRNRLVDSILDWRDPDDIPHLYGAEVNDYSQSPLARESGYSLPRNSSFQTIDELLLVKNMSPEIFYGTLLVDPLTHAYRRLPGVRDLVTVEPGSDKVDLNHASIDVLMALPGMDASMASEVVAERLKKPFTSADDVVDRVRTMFGNEALDYVTFGTGATTAVVATAKVLPSGASRTVRLLFTRTQKHTMTPIPTPAGLFYRVEDVEEIKLGHWQFQ